MHFEKISNNSRLVLSEINACTNPTQLLCQKLESCTSKERDTLKNMLSELSEKNYIKIQWADNIPYHVIITNSGRLYEEQLLEYENELSKLNSVTINVGNNNKFKNSPISINNSGKLPDIKRFYEEHPWISGILISLFAGIICMLSFWDKIIALIETFF